MSDKLTIETAPAAFSAFAEKHNALVDLIRRIRGVGPITVAISDNNILISVTGAGGSSGSPVEFITGNGKLGLGVRHSSYVTPTTYPTELGVVTGTTSISINSTGVRVVGGSIAVVTGSTSITMGSTGFTMSNASGKTCQIFFGALTYDISVREIDICDAGISKKMLVVGSAPYT
jgi:hypothetical protein